MIKLFALVALTAGCYQDRNYYVVDTFNGQKTKVTYCKEEINKIVAYKPADKNENLVILKTKTLFLLNKNYSVKKYDTQKFYCTFVEVP